MDVSLSYSSIEWNKEIEAIYRTSISKSMMYNIQSIECLNLSMGRYDKRQHNCLWLSVACRQFIFSMGWLSFYWFWFLWRFLLIQTEKMRDCWVATCCVHIYFHIPPFSLLSSTQINEHQMRINVSVKTSITFLWMDENQ